MQQKGVKIEYTALFTVCNPLFKGCELTNKNVSLPVDTPTFISYAFFSIIHTLPGLRLR